MKFSNLFKKRTNTPPERAVYAQIVAKARQPWLYLKAGVPDTVTGRFDMITLHSFILIEHIGSKSKVETDFAQAVFDEVFLDMDHSLREMGVGDLSVGKKIRKMSEIFYGACNGYREAFENSGKELDIALANAFKRNVTGEEVAADQLDRLVEYAQQLKTRIETIPVEDILTGKFDWPTRDMES